MERILVEQVIASRAGLGPAGWPCQPASWPCQAPAPSVRKEEAEGGCGVIGIAASVPVAGKHLFQALVQMRNRGNGKGGGAALVGLSPADYGVTAQLLRDDYLLAIAYIDPTSRADVERSHVEPFFHVDHVHEFPQVDVPGLPVRPPQAVAYFVRVKDAAWQAFAREKGLHGLERAAIEDELVYQNTYKLNKAFYASLGEKRAFVLSHGKDMLVLKMVGYAEDVIRAYGLEEVRAHVWIGHHRYPTKG
ncbi:MAG: glutamate synthase, partial [Planctomycetota bacterium]